MKLNQKGMTLMEMMIVVAIIGGLIAVLAPGVFDNYTKARIKQASIQLNNIKNALRTYMMDCGSFPSQDVGLEALSADPGPEVCKNWGPSIYLDKRQLKDPFNHDFEYENDGTKVVITFLGKDGRPGGDKFNADVSEEEGD